MASSSSSFAPPIPINIPPGGFDVFISFRGKDTRNGFTSNLHAALRHKYILSFIDSKDLRAGDHISHSLLRAIAQSKLYIIVFSSNYASSKWCLLELVKILEERRVKGKKLMPVFYGVDPSILRYQTGSFSEAFSKHQERHGTETVKIWKDALVEAANLSGYDSSSIRPDSKLIKKIVEHVSEKLKQVPSVHLKGLIGIELRIDEIKSMLCTESVNKVGIWGMGGIGKTTIAKSVFLAIYTQFQGSCFLENMREELQRNGSVSMWNRFVQEIFRETSFNTSTLTLGLDVVKERLHRAKVIVVFDDVDESFLTELQPLLDEEDGLFGKESKILITSRDQQVLARLVDKIYKVDGLNSDEALQLFSRNAFKENYPPVDYEKSSMKVITYTQGNPLALKVLGASLFKRNKSYWDSALHKLQQIPKSRIMDTLRVSFDGLCQEEQDIFLDIAFGLRGEDKELAIEVLNSSYYDIANLYITNLIDKCLITIDKDNKLEMHDLLQELSRYIVRQESPNPEERSRLQDPLDIYNVLTKEKGTKKIQSITLDLSKVGEMHLEHKAFMGMNNLRFLKIFGGDDKVHFRHRDLEFLPDTLRYIYWRDFPVKSLSSMLSAENLVNLELPKSKVERLWTGKQHLVNLKCLNLERCRNLIEIPDLSNATNIESIDLFMCENLVTLHSSVQYLEKLQCLDLRNCVNLKNLPTRLESKCLDSLLLKGCPKFLNFPEIWLDNLKKLSLNEGRPLGEVPPLQNAKHLKIFEARNCLGMIKLPEISSSIELLELHATDIEEIPSSVQSLTSLYWLHLSDNKYLSTLPATICKLKSLSQLDLRNCPKLEEFPDILEPMEDLQELNLSDCQNLKRLPTNICNLKSLRWLYLRSCKLIPFIPVLPQSLWHIYADGCESLETLLSSNPRHLFECSFVNCCRLDEKTREKIIAVAQSRIKLNDDTRVCLPGTRIPKWFKFRSLGSSVTVPLPFNGNHVVGICFCIVHERRSPSERDGYIYVRFQCYADTPVQRQCSHVGEVYLPRYTTKSDHLLLVHRPTSDFGNFLPGKDVLSGCSSLSLQFSSELGDDVSVKECAVYLKFAEDSGAMRRDITVVMRRDIIVAMMRKFEQFVT